MNQLRKISLLFLISITLLNIAASSSFFIKSTAAATMDSASAQPAIEDIVKASKAVLEAKGMNVNHVELVNKDTYPVFHLNHDALAKLDDNKLLNEIAGKNGYSDFKAIDDCDSMEVYCNRTLGRVERTVVEKGLLDFLLDKSTSMISVDEARAIAECGCKKPEVGVRADYAAKCDVVIANTRYYCFDLVYQLPKVEKEIITYKKIKKKLVPVRKIVIREARIKTIPAVMINSVDRSAYEAVKEKTDNGLVEYYLTHKLEPGPSEVSGQ
jgi:hypothetical protein